MITCAIKLFTFYNLQIKVLVFNITLPINIHTQFTIPQRLQTNSNNQLFDFHENGTIIKKIHAPKTENDKT